MSMTAQYRWKTRIAAGLAILAGCVLSACGGGGSTATAPASQSASVSPDGGDASEPSLDPKPLPGSKESPGTGSTDEVATVSTIDPMLTMPLMYATDVSLSTSIVVAYSGLVNVNASVSGTLRNAQGDLTGEMIIEGGSVVFMPHADLMPSTSYTFLLSAEVADAGGEWTRTGTTLQFKTSAAM